MHIRSASVETSGTERAIRETPPCFSTVVRRQRPAMYRTVLRTAAATAAAHRVAPWRAFAASSAAFIAHRGAPPHRGAPASPRSKSPPPPPPAAPEVLSGKPNVVFVVHGVGDQMNDNMFNASLVKSGTVRGVSCGHESVRVCVHKGCACGWMRAGMRLTSSCALVQQ